MASHSWSTTQPKVNWSQRFIDSSVILNSVEELKVHKHVLADNSPVFEAMLSQDIEEAGNNKCAIPNIEDEMVVHSFKHMYSDHFKTTYEKYLIRSVVDKSDLESKTHWLFWNLVLERAVDRHSESVSIHCQLPIVHTISHKTPFVKYIKITRKIEEVVRIYNKTNSEKKNKDLTALQKEKEQWKEGGNVRIMVKQGSDYTGVFLINQMGTISKLYTVFKYKANRTMKNSLLCTIFCFRKSLLFSELMEIETCKPWLLIQDRQPNQKWTGVLFF